MNIKKNFKRLWEYTSLMGHCITSLLSKRSRIKNFVSKGMWNTQESWPFRQVLNPDPTQHQRNSVFKKISLKMLLNQIRALLHLLSLATQSVAARHPKTCPGEWGLLCFEGCVIGTMTFISMILKLLVLLQGISASLQRAARKESNGNLVKTKRVTLSSFVQLSRNPSQWILSGL